MKDVYALYPVNKTAAIVTSNGSESNDKPESEQLRDNLVARWKKVQMNLQSFPKKSPRRKELGRELVAIQDKIHAIRPAKKAIGVRDYFITCAKERLSVHVYNNIMDEAVDRMRADQGN